MAGMLTRGRRADSKMQERFQRIQMFLPKPYVSSKGRHPDQHSKRPTLDLQQPFGLLSRTVFPRLVVERTLAERRRRVPKNEALMANYLMCPPPLSSATTTLIPTSKSRDPQEAPEPSGTSENRGKGTPRRKAVKKPTSSNVDDKKLQTILNKMNSQPIKGIEEVNMFKSDGNVLHFASPHVSAAFPSNTFSISGRGEDKELTELVPGILNQLGPDSLASLRKLAESYQNMQKEKGEGAEGADKEDDDDIPDLVPGQSFDNAKDDAPEVE
ncbi:hypothetical protein FH972_021366 [Carpinus fangiana]|uniref:Nascent polypeptide-associated complex subunit beta n=1 Tax=Carpinus fangiana TaxID=176857 RepID=A0A5N6KP52_9ROSI|nr:hypothetical protein FH972_021366 [Carpinus fangiana]